MRLQGEQAAPCLPAIPHRVKVAESLAFGVPLVAWAPGNDAARAYQAACGWLLRWAALGNVDGEGKDADRIAF